MNLLFYFHRNTEIARKVIDGSLTSEIAEEYGLSTPRIIEICNKLGRRLRRCFAKEITEYFQSIDISLDNIGSPYIMFRKHSKFAEELLNKYLCGFIFRIKNKMGVSLTSLELQQLLQNRRKILT